MGGVHPSGQNVVRLGQHAGGHNCNMGEPYFDVNEVINDVRLTSIISREEIQDKVLEATKKVQINQKRCCRQMIPLIFIAVVMPQMFRFLEPATVVCNSSGSTEDSTESCYVKCCPNHDYDGYRAEHDEELRVFIWPYASYLFWIDAIDSFHTVHSKAILIFFLFANTGLSLLQFFWGWKILKRALIDMGCMKLPSKKQKKQN